MQEIRVYLVDADADNAELTDERFMEVAEQEGLVYSLKGFEEAINWKGLDMDIFFIRFL